MQYIAQSLPHAAERLYLLSDKPMVAVELLPLELYSVEQNVAILFSPPPYTVFILYCVIEETWVIHRGASALSDTSLCFVPLRTPYVMTSSFTEISRKGKVSFTALCWCSVY